MDTAYQIFTGVMVVATVLLLIPLLRDFLFHSPPKVTREFQASYAWGEYEPLISYLEGELLEVDNWTASHYPDSVSAHHKFRSIGVTLKGDALQLHLHDVEGRFIDLLADNNLLLSAAEKKRLAVPAMTLILTKQQALIEDLSADLPLDPRREETYDTLEDTI